MRRFLLGTLLSLAIAIVIPTPASAQEYNHIIKVYAIVPEQRAIYLDETGNIIKVAGNTSKNVTPQVINSNNVPVSMTDAVQKQYDDFLKQHNYHLQASKIYEFNPLIVNNMANTQEIKLINDQLSLGNLKIK